MTRTIKLATPVEFGGKTYAELTFRKPKTRDMVTSEMAAKNMGPQGQVVAMLACMADVPLPAMQETELEDLNNIISEMADFLGNAPAPLTGAP